MDNALVIVDAWQNVLAQDLELFPNLEDEITVFCQYLNHVCEHERNKGTRIIFCSNKPINNAIKPKDGDLVLNRDLGPLEFAKLDYQYYFAGFHHNRCIKTVMKEAIRYRLLPSRCGIVLNLTMTFPGDSWKITKADNVYLWSQKDFEEIMVR